MTIAMVGLIGSAIYSTLLLPKRPRDFGIFRQLGMIVQWILVPFTILFFGAIVCGIFWYEAYRVWTMRPF